MNPLRWGALRDTLALRLFVLMWAALVLSHALAWLATTQLALPLGRPPAPGLASPADTAPPPRPPPPGGWPGAAGAPPPPPGQAPLPTFPSLPPALPWHASLVDYGVRLLLLALAAAWGARWLARPMQRLVQAAQTLSPALQRGQPAPALPQSEGTQEVRAAAAVFNGMARELQQQFESRALMVAALSHDLRTPITRLRMRLETADVDPALVARSAADLREMAELIESVLAVFRPGDTPEALPRTDVAALAQALADDLAETGAAVAFEEPPAGAACIARADALLLKRVIGNLVHNALRYAGAAELRVQRHGERLRVEVADRGPGIPAHQLEAVMQPFTRLEHSRSRDTGGVGLGLYIAREGAARLGGELRLQARDGGGLQDELWLPAG